MRRCWLLGVALLAGVASTAGAQNFKFETGTPYSPQPTLYGYYVSPYRGTFLSEPGQPTVDIWCVDFFHEVSNGRQWTATFTNMGSGDLSSTYGMRFRGWSEGIAEQRYKAAAWLASQFNLGNKSQWPDYQAAIWSLMGQNSAGDATAFPYALNSTRQGWLNTAVAASGTVDGAEWTVISDVQGSSAATQEFIARYNVVPEPGTILLLATGLIAIGGLAYFRGFSA